MSDNYPLPARLFLPLRHDRRPVGQRIPALLLQREAVGTRLFDEGEKPSALQLVAILGDRLVVDILLSGLAAAQADIPKQKLLIRRQFVCHLGPPSSDPRSLTTLRIFSIA